MASRRHTLPSILSVALTLKLDVLVKLCGPDNLCTCPQHHFPESRQRCGVVAMAFPIPSHLPRRAPPQDVSSQILSKIDSATNQTLNSALVSSWLTELEVSIQTTKVFACYCTCLCKYLNSIVGTYTRTCQCRPTCFQAAVSHVQVGAGTLAGIVQQCRWVE